ncbi:MAG TPA: hypothetical protein VIH99_10540 [Bdellovibrionota bacterium]|jgi:hypothetical protein
MRKTKTEARCWSWSSRHFFWRFFRPVASRYSRRTTDGSSASSTGEAIPSARPGRRPSSYLLVASLFLLTGACLCLPEGSQSLGPEELLRQHGWVAADRLTCTLPQAGSYLEIENGEAVREAYYQGGNSVLVSRLPLPEAPYLCREIEKPTFVEEVP